MLKVNHYSNEILKNISFFMEDNFIILGSNGAGKSTLAKLLSNIIENKNVEIFGKNISLLSEKERAEKINYIPAKLDIFDEYISVEEFLQLSFLDKKYSNVEHIANALDITHLLKHSCHTLSSGERQLLLIASALAHQAEITIFDEPTSNLDQQHVKAIFNLLKYNENIKYKIIITHDLHLAYKLGYPVLFINKGEITFQGKSESFFNEESLEKYFGSSVKLINGHVVSNL